jgi:hypothetical protein
MSDIETSISLNEAKRRSRLGLGKPKKLEMLSQEEPRPKSPVLRLQLDEDNESINSDRTEVDEVDPQVNDAELEEVEPEEQEEVEPEVELEQEDEPEPEKKPSKNDKKKVKMVEPESEPEEKPSKKDKKKVKLIEPEVEPEQDNSSEKPPKKKDSKSKKNKPKFVEEEDEEQPKTNSNDEDEVIESDTEVVKKKSSKPSKPKGKYDDMTLKDLQNLTKERKVVGRSALKNREAIIAKLEELDAQPQSEEEPKPSNKYQYMTIPQLRQLMGSRNISGRSTLKTKDAMVQKLVEADENPTEQVSSGKGLGKGGAQRHKKEKEAEPEEDQEINKKVSELVNMIYKTKKFAKHQSVDFKNGFMDYIQDLTKLVEDYQESCNESQ